MTLGFDHWTKVAADLGGGMFEIPPGCETCRRFDRLFETEALPGELATMRERVVMTFRVYHHAPVGFVDRASYYLQMLKSGGWPDRLSREIARLVVMVDQNQGHPL